MSTDALSDVLSAVHLSGSVFFDVTAKSPWVAEAPPAAQIANEVTPGAQHVIEYHVVTRGSCWISLVGDIAFEPVKARGRGHRRYSAWRPACGFERAGHARRTEFGSPPPARRTPTHCLSRLRTGGEGPSDTHLICGFFSCDARPFNPLLDSLPRFMRFSRDASQASHSLLDQFIRFATAEMGNKRAGSQSVLNRLSELMFVEVIRHAHGSACEQQHRLARGIAGSPGRPRADAAARAACPRLDAGGARIGSCRLTLGAGRSICPTRGLSADSVSDPMAHADRRQATCRSQRQDCRRRS